MKKDTQKALNRTVDAAFNQQMKQNRANMDVKAKLGQKQINTGSPFAPGKPARRVYQPKKSWG